ncbi:hypothetical protein CBR_g31836 [Chara braunii]|uniref:Uncharacterized protein n=1 Tax=Chara braunii TaxID=69332 RepID=A0A388LFR2_CHABU|nr:hypothetical protein CBR_g31836 [Chara braunii]|eukprot:GBG81160.1 hypothetical protein CBR_g31836 [Chara braunii]
MYTEEEKKQINSLMDACFSDGIVPSGLNIASGLNIGVPTLTDDLARFDLSEEFSEYNVQWLKKHAVTILFLNDVAVLSNRLKKQLTDECCPVKAEVEHDPSNEEVKKITPSEPPSLGFMPMEERPPLTGFRRFFPQGDKHKRNRNWNQQARRGNEGTTSSADSRTTGGSRRRGGKGNEAKEGQKGTREKGRREPSEEDMKEELEEDEEEDGESTSKLANRAADLLARGKKNKKGKSQEGRNARKWVLRTVGDGDGSEEEGMESEKSSGAGKMDGHHGLLDAGPVITLGVEDQNIPKLLVPLILANAKEGIIIMSCLLSDGTMELPTMEADETLTESEVISKVKRLVPACLNLRIIPSLRVGVDIAQDLTGRRVRLYYVFLDARMTNQIKQQLESLDKGWFPLSCLKSPLNEGLDSITFKIWFTARTIAKWLFHSGQRQVMFDRSLVDTLRMSWEETGGSETEGIRRRKKGEKEAKDDGRIQSIHGGAVGNAS